VHLAGQRHKGRGIFHISSPSQKIDGMFEFCNERLNTSLQLLPLYDWICRIRDLHRAGQSLPIVPLIEFAFSMTRHDFDEHHRSVRTVANLHVDCERTNRELEAAGLQPPQLDEGLLRTCLEGMVTHDGELQAFARCLRESQSSGRLLLQVSCGQEADEAEQGIDELHPRVHSPSTIDRPGAATRQG